MTGDAFEDALYRQPRLGLSVDLARRAGRMAVDQFERAPVSWKTDGTMVTTTDLEIQAMLKEQILSVFPDDDVLGEEEPNAVLADAKCCWILDPIDGTANFGRGIPGFAISIGLLEAGQPKAGAVYDPLADQLFAGLTGWGAWLNGRRLRLDSAELSSRSMCAIRTPFTKRVPAFVQEWLCRYRLRRIGSTALTLCYVASGALAFAYDHRASLWDIAGAVPVLVEAGGIITSPAGLDLFPMSAAARSRAVDFLAGDPFAHDRGLADIRELG